MIVIPQLNPAVLKTFEVDFGTSIAQVLWQKVVDHINWLNASLPIGTVIYFYASQTYPNNQLINSPNSCWHFCDGTAIDNQNSLLHGISVPDLRKLFLKGSPSFGITGGSETVNLAHNHGGITGYLEAREGNRDSDLEDDEIGGPVWHAHPISMDLDLITMLPPYVELQPYMRIV